MFPRQDSPSHLLFSTFALCFALGVNFPLVDFNNLILAAKKAEKRKKFRSNVLEFNYNLEIELIQLQKKLIERTYRPGNYRIFYIQEPKTRSQAS